MKADNFTQIPLIPQNMDRYFGRLAILKALAKAMGDFKGTLLDLGCGEKPYKEYVMQNKDITRYIGMDVASNTYSGADVTWDGKQIPYSEGFIDCVMATELFEHLPNLEAVLKEIRIVLKPGGLLFFTVPFLWPLHDTPNDEYRYTPFSLTRHLRNAGFTDIKIEALGGWDASFAQMMGLWLRRRPMKEEQRDRIAADMFGLYKELLETDEPPTDFNQNVMVTGFSGVAR